MITAVSARSGARSKWFSTVVLPLPRNPVMTVTGTELRRSLRIGRKILHSPQQQRAAAARAGGEIIMAAESHNMRLISRDKLAGFGNVGEGMSMQLTGSGRRI